MTILIAVHQSVYRNFKAFYLEKVKTHRQSAFPALVSQRFVEWMPTVLVPLCAYLRHCFGRCTGISFMDSTSLKVCHNRRIQQHKVFAEYAKRGKTSVDWFFGFKLHLVVNDQGELLNVIVTEGNIDDRAPVSKLLQGLRGKVFADKGYVSKALRESLWKTSNIELITNLKRNIKNHLMLLADRLLLRRHSILESIIDQLKNISQIVREVCRRHTFPPPQPSQLGGFEIFDAFVGHRYPSLCPSSDPSARGLMRIALHQPKKPSLALYNALPTAT